MLCHACIHVWMLVCVCVYVYERVREKSTLIGSKEDKRRWAVKTTANHIKVYILYVWMCVCVCVFVSTLFLILSMYICRFTMNNEQCLSCQRSEQQFVKVLHLHLRHLRLCLCSLSLSPSLALAAAFGFGGICFNLVQNLLQQPKLLRCRRYYTNLANKRNQIENA